MSDAVAEAERAGSAVAHTWEVPGKGISVWMSCEAMDRVLVEGLRGLGLVPRRGAEIGGVLLGAVEGGASGEPARVRIDAVLPVACEYTFGPSYVLSAADHAAFRRAVEQAEGRAVGYYRSHTRERLTFTQADLELFRECFPERWNVALLVKPRAMRASVAGFFIWEDGAVRETSHLEFRVQARAGLKRMAEAAEEPAPQAAATPDVPLPAFLQGPAPAGSGARRPVRWFSWWIQIPLMAGLLLANSLLGFSAARHLRSGGARPAGDPYALGLAVSGYGDNLHLSWNRNAPALRTARGGVLSIADGGLARTLDLSPAQLRSGSVFYRRLTREVKLKLEVLVSDRASVAETWNYVAPAAAAVPESVQRARQAHNQAR